MGFYILELALLLFGTVSYLKDDNVEILICFALGLGARYAKRCNTPNLVGFSSFKQQSNNFMFGSILLNSTIIFILFEHFDPFSLKQLFWNLSTSLWISNTFICTTCVPAWILMRLVTKKVKVYSKYYHMLLLGIFLLGFLISSYVLARIGLSDRAYLYSLVLVICFLFLEPFVFAKNSVKVSSFPGHIKTFLLWFYS